MKTEDVFGNLPTLETERLLLRKMKLEDARDLFEYASDPEVTRFTTWSTHQSLQESEEFLRSVLEQYAKQAVASWGVVHKGDVKLIGVCGFNAWWLDHARAEMGYALSRKYWGQSLMTEAVQAVVDFGFRTMELNRIQAVCNIENAASARVMEKVGMTYEGTLREYSFSKGHYSNLKMYSILRREWDVKASPR